MAAPAGASFAASTRKARQVGSLLALLLVFCTIQRSLAQGVLLRKQFRSLQGAEGLQLPMARILPILGTQ